MKNEKTGFIVITAEDGITGTKLCKNKNVFLRFIRSHKDIVYGFLNLETREHGILNQNLWNGKVWSF